MNLTVLNFVVGIMAVAIGIGLISSGQLIGFLPIVLSGGSWYVVGMKLLKNKEDTY